MSRPRKPTPFAIMDLRYNPNTKHYEITERGITYQMELEHTRLLKEYFKGVYTRNHTANVSDWYNKLDNLTRKEILRTGNIQSVNDFYPDQSYED